MEQLTAALTRFNLRPLPVTTDAWQIRDARDGHRTAAGSAVGLTPGRPIPDGGRHTLRRHVRRISRQTPDLLALALTPPSILLRTPYMYVNYTMGAGAHRMSDAVACSIACGPGRSSPVAAKETVRTSLSFLSVLAL